MTAALLLLPWLCAWSPGGHQQQPHDHQRRSALLLFIDQHPYLCALLDDERVELVMHQFVTITSGGQLVKQSTRRATFVTIDELVAEIGEFEPRATSVARRLAAQDDAELREITD